MPIPPKKPAGFTDLPTFSRLFRKRFGDGEKMVSAQTRQIADMEGACKFCDDLLAEIASVE